MFNLITFTLLASASANRVLQYDFDVLGRTEELVKRDNTGKVTIVNDRIGYFLNFSLGSPEQLLYAQLDTGSSDLWVLGPDSEYCKSGEPPSFTSDHDLVQPGPTDVVFPDFDCQGYGSFDSDNSKTYNNTEQDFETAYADGTFASGEWSTDTLRIGDDIEIKEFVFGLADKGNSTPVFGIGFPAIEASAAGIRGENFTYPNLPQRLAKDGIINTPAYSLYLGARNAPAGSILFGGVDHSKYSGSLTTYPIVNDELSITLKGIGVQSGDKFNQVIEGETAVILDSGTTRIGLPSSVLDLLAEEHMAYSYYYGLYGMACTDAVDLSWVFQFGDNSIQVPALDFMAQYEDGTCYLLSQESDSIILGDFFLRHAYVVFDLYNREISIAEAKFDTKESDIEEIDTKGVPKATMATAKEVTSAWLEAVTGKAIKTDEGVVSTEVLASWSNTYTFTGNGDLYSHTSDASEGSTQTTQSSKSTGAAGKIEASVLVGVFTLLSVLCIV